MESQIREGAGEKRGERERERESERERERERDANQRIGTYLTNAQNYSRGNQRPPCIPFRGFFPVGPLFFLRVRITSGSASPSSCSTECCKWRTAVANKIIPSSTPRSTLQCMRVYMHVCARTHICVRACMHTRMLGQGARAREGRREGGTDGWRNGWMAGGRPTHLHSRQAPKSPPPRSHTANAVLAVVVNGLSRGATPRCPPQGACRGITSS